MHIHPNQSNPYAQLDAIQSAQKSEAKAAAERTRKKLMESASELSGEATEEAYFVEVVRRGFRRTSAWASEAARDKQGPCAGRFTRTGSFGRRLGLEVSGPQVRSDARPMPQRRLCLQFYLDSEARA
jgi:hypothetical protein